MKTHAATRALYAPRSSRVSPDIHVRERDMILADVVFCVEYLHLNSPGFSTSEVEDKIFMRCLILSKQAGQMAM